MILNIPDEGPVCSFGVLGSVARRISEYGLEGQIHKSIMSFGRVSVATGIMATAFHLNVIIWMRDCSNRKRLTT